MFQVSLVSSAPVWPFLVPAATWQLCVCYCKPLTALLHHVLFFVFFGVRVSLCPNTLTQIIQNWLAGRQIWNNPFRCLFKSLSACELSRQTWSFSIYTRLPQKIFHIASSDTFCRQVGLTERNVCQKPHQQVVWTSFKEKKKRESLSCFCLNAICQLFFLRLPLKCDCSEWRWAKPLNKVGVQREKLISPALSETLREQDRLMRMNVGPPTH